MSILSSFNIGISGLSSAAGGMAVISDNIANVGTFGFKASRPEFQDILAQSLKGIDGGDQIGVGTMLAHVTPDFTQGNIQRTEKVTDIAINGNGFFEVMAPFGSAYTRDGSFHFDKEGYLINGDGYRVNGFQVDGRSKVTNEKGPLRLGNTTIPARATRDVEVNMNLDSREQVKRFNPKNPEKTSSYNNSFTVYDSVGTARLITVFFNKLGNSVWEYHAMSDGKDVPGQESKAGALVPQASGTLVFNKKGWLQREKVKDNAFNFNGGAQKGQKIRFNFGESLAEGGTGLDSSTQFGSESTIARHVQDGATAAQLASLSFNDKGVLIAVYNNGVFRDIGQVGVAKFENNEGLFKVGKNLFKESRKSGQSVFGRPEEGGRGSVLSKSIEISNVDLASEFVNLMASQRNFQASAKTITTADQMLQEVLSLKR